jgi:hypothetical protein
LKYLHEAVGKVRRAEHRELQQTGDDRLKGMRHTLLFNPENLSDKKMTNSQHSERALWRPVAHGASRSCFAVPDQEGGTHVKESPRPNSDTVLLACQQRHVRRIQQPHPGN